MVRNERKTPPGPNVSPTHWPTPYFKGMIWEKLLTDKDGQYTEIQSGRLFNQAAGESSKTPFKNRGFAAGATDQWTEYWFPVKETNGIKYAEPTGSVNLQQDGNNVTVGFCPNEKCDGKLEVRNGTTTVFTKDIHSGPMQVTKSSFKIRWKLQFTHCLVGE